MKIEAKRKAKNKRKYQSTVELFVRSSDVFRLSQIKSLRKQGFSIEHSLLPYTRGISRFGVVDYRKQLVIFYRLKFALTVGIDRIMEGVESLNDMATDEASSTWIKKLQP